MSSRLNRPRLGSRRFWLFYTPISAACFLLAQALNAQDTPAPKSAPLETTPTNTIKVGDLAARYRFSERYTEDDAKVAPGIVGAYRVATREVIRESVESPQGAPKRTDLTRQAIYAERVAEQGMGAGNVLSTVRSIERYQAKPEDSSKPIGVKPLEGAVVLVRPRSGELPLVLSLTEGRSITEFEFDTLAHQPFIPALSQLFPPQAVRLRDTWRIPRKAAQAMLGDPTIQADNLTGKLVEVRREVDGPRMVASIAIAGKVPAGAGEAAVNAEVLFTFVGSTSPKTSTKKTFPPNPYDDLTEARGAVTEVRMTCVTNGPVPGPGRLRFVSNRELTLHRQLGTGSTPLPKFDKIPESSLTNSWLTHLDASGRFTFNHPQDFLPNDPGPSARPGPALLSRLNRAGRDMLQVEFLPRTLAVEDLKKAMAEKYAMLKMEKLDGDESWLPETDWPGVRVHRIDAALKVSDPKGIGMAGVTRIHFDGYLMQFPQSASVLAIATTSKEAVGPFRGEVEAILKTIKVDPPRPQTK